MPSVSSLARDALIYTDLIILHTDGPLILDDDLRDGGVHGDLQIFSVAAWTEERRRATLSDAVLICGLCHAESCKLVAIEVLANRISFLLRRREYVVGDRGLPGKSSDIQ